MKSKNQFLREWAAATQRPAQTKAMRSKNDTKDFSGTPILYAFVDMDYWCLISKISWVSPATGNNLTVEVPRGFVTDFASVPRIFWSIIPPIGRYGYPAVFHDYLYWNQNSTRQWADKVFMYTMLELSVPMWKALLLYYSVRLFGFSAWRNNAALKESGEVRVLLKIPSDLSTSWADWKKIEGAFASNIDREPN